MFNFKYFYILSLKGHIYSEESWKVLATGGRQTSSHHRGTAHGPRLTDLDPAALLDLSRLVSQAAPLSGEARRSRGALPNHLEASKTSSRPLRDLFETLRLKLVRNSRCRAHSARCPGWHSTSHLRNLRQRKATEKSAPSLWSCLACSRILSLLQGKTGGRTGGGGSTTASCAMTPKATPEASLAHKRLPRGTEAHSSQHHPLLEPQKTQRHQKMSFASLLR